jgi:hypothetical protein
MYYIIYDNQYPMAAFMSYNDIIGMAEDILGAHETLKERGYSPFPGLCHQPETPAQYLKAAQEVLEEHWGLFQYHPYDEAGEFIWYATEHNILDQATALIKLHDPEFARIELGE